jgi:hypothetical protein
VCGFSKIHFGLRRGHHHLDSPRLTAIASHAKTLNSFSRLLRLSLLRRGIYKIRDVCLRLLLYG